MALDLPLAEPDMILVPPPDPLNKLRVYANLSPTTHTDMSGPSHTHDMSSTRQQLENQAEHTGPQTGAKQLPCVEMISKICHNCSKPVQVYPANDYPLTMHMYSSVCITRQRQLTKQKVAVLRNSLYGPRREPEQLAQIAATAPQILCRSILDGHATVTSQHILHPTRSPSPEAYCSTSVPAEPTYLCQDIELGDYEPAAT